MLIGGRNYFENFRVTTTFGTIDLIFFCATTTTDAFRNRRCSLIFAKNVDLRFWDVYRGRHEWIHDGLFLLLLKIEFLAELFTKPKDHISAMQYAFDQVDLIIGMRGMI